MISDNNTSNITETQVVYCSTEQEYYQAIESARNKLVVVDCFAEW